MIVTHIITGLNDGGAEAVLYRLCTTDGNNSHTVISLQGEGKYGQLLKNDGIGVYCLDMPRGRVTLRGIWKLSQLLRKLRPNVVQTWMYHSDLIGGVVARVVGIRNIIWGLHTTNLEKGKTKRATIVIAHILAFISRWIPKRVVSCSHRAVEVHRDLGFDSDKFTVIPNGYDLREFYPGLNDGAQLKSSLLSSEIDIPLIGMVARFDPQKDHHNLISALGLIKQSGHDFRCALVGGELTDGNAKLIEWLNLYDVRDRVILLGSRNDIPVIMNALDVHVLSSSYGEAFPNVLCESMACGTPCITTDVGDSALIVGDTGWVVPVKSEKLLAKSIIEAIDEIKSNPIAWRKRKSEASRSIKERFSVETMVDSYDRVWSKC